MYQDAGRIIEGDGARLGPTANVIAIVQTHRSEPGSNVRYVLRLEDGAEVEAVVYRGDTACLSTQVGCGVRCPFCASGANGLSRSLDAGTMMSMLATLESEGHAIARVTLSGSGEPMHASDACAEVVRRCHARRTPASITTSGGPLHRMSEWLSPDAPPHNGITISVHAGTESVRAQMVPGGPALGDLFALLADRIPKLPRKRRKKIALAYLVIEGSNDSDEEIDAFAERARSIRAPIHLYAHNPVPTSSLRGVSRDRYEAIYERLRARDLVVRMSSQARIEANGGCGTLVALRATRASARRPPTEA